MSGILFIGPVASAGGPAIKNRVLVTHLLKSASLEVWNTYDRSLWARLGAVASLLFTKQRYIMVAVSRKGRDVLYPLLLLKRRIFKCHYSCVVIGGDPMGTFRSRQCVEALRQADIAVVETRGLKAWMEEAYGLKNVRWMPNYKELDGSIPAVTPGSFGSGPLRLVFLSSMRNEKGVKTLLYAFRKCGGLDIELDFYGPVRDDFDKNLLYEIERTAGVRYRGAVKNSDVLHTLRQYHVFVFPTESRTEGFPAVLAEAQCAGLPVIASDASYNSEIIRDGVNGFIFPPGDADQLAEKIRYCCSHREDLAGISERNLQAAAQYDAAAVIGGYCKALRMLGWPL